MTGDPYVDPSTGVLLNILGCTDTEELQRLEHVLAQLRDQELLARPLPGRFDLPHLRRLHRALFRDVYSWAGDLRTVNIDKGSPFASSEFIEGQAQRVFDQLALRGHLRGLEIAEFVSAAADLLGDVNALHPFSEGNGRAQRAYLRQLAAEAGYLIDWSGVSIDENVEASYCSLAAGDNSGLATILARVTSPLTERPRIE